MDSLMPQVEEIALTLMSGLDCPRSVTVAILIRYGEWVQLAELVCSPGDYATAEAFGHASAATNFLRKYSGLPTGTDTRAVACAKWLEAEAACYWSNERLSPFLHGVETEGPLFEFLEQLKREVIALIGWAPPAVFDGRFGPGATVSDKSRMCTVPDKLCSVPSLTPEAIYHLVPWTGTQWASGLVEDLGETRPLSGLLRFVRGNVFFTVPKDATTDRACAKEPSINAFYQLGVGGLLRDRLKQRSGVDLNSLPALHKSRARESSLTGEDATIDLSSASDTVCVNLVKLALPPKWFELLDSLRSSRTLFEGRWTRLEKFSSMGNGFTFELETILFLAIGKAMTRLTGGEPSAISVFGDDIICRTSDSSAVLSALSFCGFTPNKRKTYVDGEFRESCGGDFFRGQAVRPYFLKDIPDENTRLIGIANGLRRLSYNLGCSQPRWPPVARSWLKAIGYLPARLRLIRGPEEFGDSVLWDSEDRWIIRWRSSIRYVQVYRAVSPATVRWSGFGAGTQLAAALYLAGKGRLRPIRDFRGNLTSRDSVSGY